MSWTPDEIVIGAGGYFGHAPVGTTGPVALAALANPHKDFGGISEDGFEVNRSVDWETVKVWQSPGVAKYFLTGIELTLEGALVNWNKEATQQYFGGTWEEESEGIYRLDVPSDPVFDERMYVLDWKHGLFVYRMVVPRATMSDQGAITLNRGEPAAMQVTISAIATDDAPLAYILTNDVAMEPAA